MELLNRKSLHSSLHTITDSLTLTLTFLCVTSGYDMSNDKQQMCGHSIENVHEMSRYSYTIFMILFLGLKAKWIWDWSEKQNAQHLMIVEKQEIY